MFVLQEFVLKVSHPKKDSLNIFEVNYGVTLLTNYSIFLLVCVSMTTRSRMTAGNYNGGGYELCRIHQNKIKLIYISRKNVKWKSKK